MRYFTASTLTPAEWQGVHEIATDLDLPFKLGKTLQTEVLSPGQFFAAWKGTTRSLSGRSSNLARKIYHAMQTREQMLFTNDILLAGL